MRALLPVVALVGCGTAPSEPAPGGSLEAPALSPSAVAGLWPRQMLEDSKGLQDLLDGPHGDAVVALQRGDLAEAGRLLATALGQPPAPSDGKGRLLLARVHLEIARMHDAARRLHQESSWAVVQWRRSHLSAIRPGRAEPLLSAVDALAASEPASAAALLDAWKGEWRWQEDGPWASAPLVDAGRCRMAANDSCWPQTEPFRGPAAAEALAQDLRQGRLAESFARLTAPESPPWLPFLDELGSDPEAGVAFLRSWWDPSLHRSLDRVHLAQARLLAGTLPGAEGLLVDLRVRWPDAPAGAMQAQELPRTESPAAHWIGAIFGPVSTDRLEPSLPPLDPASPTLPAQVDAWLAAVARLEPALPELLTDALPPETVEIVSALSLVPRHTDALLREGAARLAAAGQWTQARRLAERSLDPSPDQARTRVSARNDRAFLLDYARILWRSGDPSSALDVAQPLAEEDRSLAPIVENLAQLDAASTLGQVGKASQQ